MQVVNVTAENGSHLQTWCPVLLKRSVQLLTLHISGRNDYPFWTRLWDYRLKITGICIISYTVIFMATTRVPPRVDMPFMTTSTGTRCMMKVSILHTSFCFCEACKTGKRGAVFCKGLRLLQVNYRERGWWSYGAHDLSCHRPPLEHQSVREAGLSCSSADLLLFWCGAASIKERKKN